MTNSHSFFISNVYVFFVSEIGAMLHPCESDLVCKGTNAKVPYFNAPVYLENKSQIGKIDEIFGPMNEYVRQIELYTDS